jgi:hypothetical protein
MGASVAAKLVASTLRLPLLATVAGRKPAPDCWPASLLLMLRLLVVAAETPHSDAAGSLFCV